MHRPNLVGDAIRKLGNGLQVGSYGRFTLYSAYQPIYRYRHDTLELIGLEGLVRPYVGDVSVTPSMLFQQTRFEDSLFVECMCHSLHIRNFQAAAPDECDLFINVNLASYRSLKILKREFSILLSKLWMHGLSAQSLVFEILETEPCCNEILIWLRQFARASGIRIAIDDFGMGYFNVERYRLLNPDIVKIDGNEFARTMRTKKESYSLQSLIKRVHDDGGKVVIEGIETPTLLAMALEFDGDLFQGRYLDAPCLPPSDFTIHRFPVQSNALH